MVSDDRYAGLAGITVFLHVEVMVTFYFRMKEGNQAICQSVELIIYNHYVGILSNSAIYYL